MTQLQNFPAFKHASLFVVTCIVFSITLSLAPTKLTSANYGMDGGDFLAAILTGGIPHPTGYPTYIILGRLLQNLPYGTPVFRATLLSIIPAALAAGLSTTWAGFWDERAHPGTIVSGSIVGLAWGTSLLFLSQAVIVEVHSLQSFFVILTLFWCMLLLKYPIEKLNKYLFPGLALAFGVGLGNHITLLLFLPAIGYAFASARRAGMDRRLVLAQLFFVFMGVTVYLYLPLQARHYPPVNWGNPQSIQGFFWLLTANPYQNFLFEIQPSTLIERMGALINLLRQQFGVAGLVAGAVGATLMDYADRRQTGLLLWAFFVCSFFAVIYHVADSTSYLIPACLAFSLWIGYLILLLWDVRWHLVPIGKIYGIAMLAYLIARIPGTYREVDPRKATQPDDFAQTYLQAAPPGALLLTQSDADTFPLWYYHFGLGWRKDLAVIALPLSRFIWYQETLLHTYPDLKFPSLSQQDESTIAWGERIPSLNPKRTVCQSQLDTANPLTISYTCLNPMAP